MRVVRVRTRAIASRWYAMTGHERFREHLAALELCRGARGTKDSQPTIVKEIRDAAIERQLRSHDGEIDTLSRGQHGKRGGIARRDGSHPRNACNPGIAGCTNHLADARLARQLPRERM